MYSREWMAKIRRREARKKKKLEATKTGKGTNPSRADSGSQRNSGFSR